MKRIQLTSMLLALAGAAAGAAGCGDSGQTCGDGTVAEGGECVPDNPIECGPGTVEQDGECVPESTVECGAGTTEVDGECLPDGSVICEQGTVFDEDTGTCVLDPTACADGTVLVGDECVPEDDTLPGMADHTEAAEPNGPGDANLAGQFAAPAVGSNVTFYGCVDPTISADGDFDTWIVTTTGPTVVEITLDGIGGLAAGFAVVDANGNALLSNWQRLGVNLTGDTSRRQVYLPSAGAWGLFTTDSRTLFFGEAAGNADSCYFGTVTSVATPAAVPLTVPQTAATDDGNVKIYSYNADQIADILDLTVNETAGALSPGMLVSRNGTLIASLADDGSGNPLFITQGGLNTTGDELLFVWDAEYNYALAPQPFTVDSFDIAAQALPTDGSVLTVTKRNGTTPTAGYVDLNYLYFDVASPSILHWNLTSSVAIDMQIVRRDVFTPAGAFDTFANINAFGGTGVTTFQGQFTRFLTPGRYYFVAQDPTGVSGATYTVTSTLTAMSTSAVTYGTPTGATALPTQGSAFHTLDLTTPVWVQFQGTGTDWAAAQVRIEAYDLAGQGWLTATAGNYAPVFAANQVAAGTAPFGRIMLGDTRDYLIRVTSSAAVGAAPMYDLSIGDRPHTNLGTIVAGTPINNTSTGLAGGGGFVRFLVQGTAANLLTATATPSAATNDIRIQRLNADESANGAAINATGSGGAETLNTSFAAEPGNWVAYTITNTTAALPTDVSSTLTAQAPVLYTVTSGTLPFVDACTGGVTHGTNQDDEYIANAALPFAFSLHGTAVTHVIIAANGFIQLGGAGQTNPTCQFGCFANQAIPSAAVPNGFIAAHWDDQESTTICSKYDAAAGTYTVQWVGATYVGGAGIGPATAHQIVLHETTNVIDLIWGPGQVETSAVSTVGTEHGSGLFGNQISFNTAGVALPNTSRTLTPPP